LADILCIWNLALVLYQDAAGNKVDFELIFNKSLEILNKSEIFNLSPDPRKNWKIKHKGNGGIESLIQLGNEILSAQNISVVFNFGGGNEIDIFNLMHKTVNDYWNSIRKQKKMDDIFYELVKVFVVWIIATQVISKHMRYNISIENIIEIAGKIFTHVADKKFNIKI